MSEDLKEILDKSRIRNYRSEIDTLAGLIRTPETLYDIDTYLHSSDFHSPVASKLYGVIRNLIIEKEIKKLDSAIILHSVNELNFSFPVECNITDYVNRLVETSKSIESGTVLQLAKAIKLYSLRRDMFESGSSIQKAMCLNNFENLNSIVNAVDEIYAESLSGIVVENETEILGQGAGESLHKRADSPVEHIGFSSGFRFYDEEIGYLRPDSFNYVTARAKVGKTMFGLNVAHHVAQFERIPVFYADSEMDRQADGGIRDRLIAHISGVHMDLIETGKWKHNQDVCDAVIAAIKVAEKLPIYYHSIRATNVAGMISACKRFLHKQVKRNSRGEWNPCLFIWDYIKLDFYNEKNLGSNWWLDIAKSVVHFKDFVGQVKQASLVLGQNNQIGIARKDPKTGKMFSADNESVVAGTDEINKSATSTALLRFKNPEEMIRDGDDAGNVLLMPFLSRTGKGGSFVQISEGVFEREYICMKRTAENMTFKEVTTNSIIRKKQDIGHAVS